MAQSGTFGVGVDFINSSVDVDITSTDAGVWSLECNVSVEDIDANIQETKVSDIVLSGSFVTEELAIDFSENRETTMDLDVSMVINGVSSNIVESQVVTYDNILKITDYSQESSNEKRFASSAKAAKKIYDIAKSVEDKTSTISGKVTNLEKRVDYIEINGGGGSGGSGGGSGEIPKELLDRIYDIEAWKDELDEALSVDDGDVWIENNLVVKGDTASGGVGDPSTNQGVDEEDVIEIVEREGYVKQTDIDSSIAALKIQDYAKKTDLDAKANASEVYKKEETYSKEEVYSKEETYSKEEIDAKDSALGDRVTPIEEWKKDLSKYLTIEGTDLRVKTNLIVDGDTASGGTGDPSTNKGLDEEAVLDLLEREGYATESFVTTEIGKIDLSDYAKTTEVDSKISALNIGDYAKTTYVDGELAKKASVINLDATNTKVSANEKAISALQTSLDATDKKVSANETAIADRYTKAQVDAKVKTLADADTALGNRITPLEDWKKLKESVLAKFTLDANGNVYLDGNLVVKGDTASGGSGDPSTNQGIDIEELKKYLDDNRYIDENELLGYGYATQTYVDTKTNTLSTALGNAINSKADKSSLASVATSGKYSDLSGLPTLGSLASKNSLAVADIPDLSSVYLPKTGGTITGGLSINPSNGGSSFYMFNADDTYRFTHIWDGNTARLYNIKNDGSGYGILNLQGTIQINGNTPIHSGNIGSQSVDSATKLATARTIWGQSFDGSGNVSGAISNTGHITPSADTTYNIGASSNQYKYVYASWFGAKTGSALSFGANNGTHIYVNTSGNVTIGASDLATSAHTNCKLYIDGRTYSKTGYLFDGSYGIWCGRQYTGSLATTDIVYNATSHAFYGAVSMSGTLSVTGATTLSSSLSVTGNVGIGTTSPSHKLDVYGRIRAYRDSATESQIDAENTVNRLSFGVNAAGVSYLYSPNAYDMAFSTNATRRMTITSGGNILMGTNTDDGSGAKLQVSGLAKATAFKGTSISYECASDNTTSGYGGEINRFGGGQLYIQTRSGIGALNLGNASGGVKMYGAVTLSSTLNVSGNVTLSKELYLGNNQGVYFKNASGSNVLAMYVNPSNILQIGYNNIDGVAFQKAVTMSSTLAIDSNITTYGTEYIYQADKKYRLTSFISNNIARIYNITADGNSYGDMYIGQNSTGAIVTTGGLYVGIGITPSTNYKFEVNGTSYFGGNVTTNGNLIVTGDVAVA